MRDVYCCGKNFIVGYLNILRSNIYRTKEFCFESLFYPSIMGDDVLRYDPFLCNVS